MTGLGREGQVRTEKHDQIREDGGFSVKLGEETFWKKSPTSANDPGLWAIH